MNIGSLLALKDADGAIFGVWIGERVKEVCGAYYGSGDSFLWKAEAGSESQSETGGGLEDGKKGKGVEVKTFGWTGKNDYVALCSDESISFGGG